MAKARVTTKMRVKKKTWFPILAPKMFNSKKLGESYLADPVSAVDRMLSINLREITQNGKDQNKYVFFKIIDFADASLQTEVDGYKLHKSNIKRMVRRKNDRLDESFVVETKDGKKVRIKTICVTAFSTKRSVGSVLRATIKDLLVEEISGLNFGNLVDKLISRKIQMGMKSKLNKLFPVKIFDFKSMSLVHEKGFQAVK